MGEVVPQTWCIVLWSTGEAKEVLLLQDRTMAAEAVVVANRTDGAAADIIAVAGETTALQLKATRRRAYTRVCHHLRTWMVLVAEVADAGVAGDVAHLEGTGETEGVHKQPGTSGTGVSGFRLNRHCRILHNRRLLRESIAPRCQSRPVV